MNNKQSGITLIGFILGTFVALVIAVFVIRFVPVYMEYLTVRDIMNQLKSEEGFTGWTKFTIKQKLDERLHINQVSHVKGSDFDIWQENHNQYLAVKYQVVVPLFANFSGLLDFDYQVEEAMSATSD